MTRRLAHLALLAAFATGCQATATGQVSVTPVDKPATGTGTTTKTRSIPIRVVGPNALAKGGANILNDAGAGLIKGGQILNDAGAGLMPRFGVLAALDAFTNVESAAVQAIGFDGKAVGSVVTTGKDGSATLTGLPTTRILTLMAAFKSGGKVYRQAALAATDDLESVLIDPINTMVEARVRESLTGKDVPGTLTNARLKRVWTICNKADITLDPAELEAGRPLADITAALNKAWQAAIDAKVTSEGEKAEIRSFVADMEAATASK
jgi:hypothetical protein